MDRMGEGQLFRYLSSGSWKKLWRSGISGTKTLFLLLEMVSDFEDYLWNTLNMQVLPSSPRFLSIPLYLPETSVACTFCVEPLVRSWGHEMQTAQGTHDLWAEPEDSVEDLTQPAACWEGGTACRIPITRPHTAQITFSALKDNFLGQPQWMTHDSGWCDVSRHWLLGS